MLLLLTDRFLRIIILVQYVKTRNSPTQKVIYSLSTPVLRTEVGMCNRFVVLEVLYVVTTVKDDFSSSIVTVRPEEGSRIFVLIVGNHLLDYTIS